MGLSLPGNHDRAADSNDKPRQFEWACEIDSPMSAGAAGHFTRGLDRRCIAAQKKRGRINLPHKAHS